MRIYRHGRVLDTQHDSLFAAQSGNAVMLLRTGTDNYIRARTPNVNCANTHHTPAMGDLDGGSQTNRWVSVSGYSLPQVIDGASWRFTQNSAVRTSYLIPNNIDNYTARFVIPAPYFPSSVVPRQFCINHLEQEDIIGRTISGAGIRWGSVVWGVGHYRIRCCPDQLVEEAACLFLAVGTNIQYLFPLWGNVSSVDLTIRRLSGTQARVEAVSSAGSFAHTFTHTLNYTHPYQAEYYLHQLNQNCTAPNPTPYVDLVWLTSPALTYSTEHTIPQLTSPAPVYLQIKTVPDPFTDPFVSASVQRTIYYGNHYEVVNEEYNYNPETNLWEPKTPFLLGTNETGKVIINTNQILERVSIMVGGATIHYTPAPHQNEWFAVVPIELEQTGIPVGIIPIGYQIMGVPDYVRVLPSGVLSVLPANYARVITLHLQERL